MKNNISRYKNMLGGEVIEFICFLARGKAKKNALCSTGTKFVSMRVGDGSKT